MSISGKFDEGGEGNQLVPIITGNIPKRTEKILGSDTRALYECTRASFNRICDIDPEDPDQDPNERVDELLSQFKSQLNKKDRDDYEKLFNDKLGELRKKESDNGNGKREDWSLKIQAFKEIEQYFEQ